MGFEISYVQAMLSEIHSLLAVDQDVELLAFSLAPCLAACCHASCHDDTRLKL